MRISWRHDDDFLAGTSSIEKKVEVFEAQMWGWQLHVADLIVNGGRNHEDDRDVEAIPHAAFAALQVALVYFEAIAKYEAGFTGRDSRKYFEAGILSVFPNIAALPYAPTQRSLELLYEGARCGLYHLAMTAPGIALARTGQAISFTSTPTRIVIDPHVLIPQLKRHFAEYVTRLRDPTEVKLRERFAKCFDHACQDRTR
jgi:hypothetical protein